MPNGFYTGYSYCGIMPDGRKAYFVSDSEYLKEYEEEAKESRPSLFRIFFNGLNEGGKRKMNEQKDLQKFKETVKKAFSEDPNEAFEGSIELSKLIGVPEDKILKSLEEVDELFLR